jgi:hypothetical protein
MRCRSALEPVQLSFLWRPMLPDANDDVVETAVNGRADLAVTFSRRYLRSGLGDVGDRRRIAGRGRASAQGTPVRKGDVAWRLQPSLMAEARRRADAEGVAVNQPINVAVAQKLSALRKKE